VYLKYANHNDKQGLIHEILSSEEGIKMGAVALDAISRNDDERVEYYHRLKYEMDMQSQMLYAESKGFEKGIEKGTSEATLNIAKKLLELNIPTEFIMTATGLPREEIEKLTLAK